MGFSKCYSLVLKFFLVLLTVSTFSIRSTTVRGLNQRRLLRDLLEEALVNNSDTLFTLQKLFFNPIAMDPERVVLSVRVTVGKIVYPESCYECGWFYKSAFSCQQSPLPNNLLDCNSWISNVSLRYEVSHNIGTGQTSNLWEGFSETTGNFTMIFDPSYYTMMNMFSVLRTPEWISPWPENYMDNYFYDSCPSSYITFEIGELKLMPSDHELANALSMLLVWVSANNSICHYTV